MSRAGLLLGRMQSGATTLSHNGTPGLLGWKKPCQKKLLFNAEPRGQSRLGMVSMCSYI